MKVHQIDETSGSEEGEYVLTVQTNEGTFVLLRRILLPHFQMFHLFGVSSFVCTVKTYSSSSLPDVSSIWSTFLDCGSTVNVLPEYLFRQCVCEKEHVEIEKSSQTLVMFNGTETKPLGKKQFYL
jgi:hypothetical protein